MSITSVNRVGFESSSVDADVLTVTERWLVISDSRSDTPATVLAASSLPSVGQAHDSISGIRVRRVQPSQQDDASLFWDVRVVYDSQVSEADEPDDPTQPQSPLDEPLMMKLRTVNSEIPWDEGELSSGGGPIPVQNSAGERFEPAPTRVVADLEVTIIRNEDTFPSTLLALTNQVNTDLFIGIFPAYTVKFTGMDGEDKRDATIGRYWTIRYQFTVRMWDDWRRKILDKGRHELDSGELVPFRDRDGRSIEKLLDGSGAESASAVFLEYKNPEGETAFDGVFGFVFD